MVRSHFQIPGLLICFILFFSACDPSKKKGIEITEKKAISIIDSLLLINEAKDSYSVPSVNSNIASLRVNVQADHGICYDTIVCASGANTVIEYHCPPPGSVTHNVTGEIGNLFTYFPNNAQISPNHSSVNRNCYPYTGEEITINGNISIEIPESALSNQDSNPITCRISILKDSEILAENSYTIKELKISDTQILPPINNFELASTDYKKRCELDTVAFADISINVSFKPEVPTSIFDRPVYRFGFQALDGSNSIVHSGYDHSTLQKKVAIPYAQLNQSLDGSVNITRAQLCPTNPQSLGDFLRINNSSKCGHQANHTLLLKIPFCSLDQININDITVNSDDVIFD